MCWRMHHVSDAEASVTAGVNPAYSAMLGNESI